MAVFIERKRARAATWSRTLGSFAALLFIMAAIGHRLGLLETPGFLAVLMLVATLACLALLLAAASFNRIWNHGDHGGRDLVLGGAVSLAVMTPFLVSAVQFVRTPPLNDITTDIADPPELGAKHTSTINRDAAAMQAKFYPEITGRRYVLDVDHVTVAVTGLVETRGWTMQSSQSVSDTETIIRAVAKTPLLALPSDVAIRITDEDGSTYVDMRSASQFGGHDLGDNARRIANFLDDLDSTVAAQNIPLPVE